MSKKKKSLSPNHQVIWAKESLDWYKELLQQCYSLIENYGDDPEDGYDLLPPFVEVVFPTVKYNVANQLCLLEEGESLLRRDFHWTFRYHDPQAAVVPLLYIFLLVRFEFLPSNVRIRNLEYVFDCMIGKDKNGNPVKADSSPRHNVNVAASMLNLLVDSPEDFTNNGKVLDMIPLKNLISNGNWSGIITAEDLENRKNIKCS